MYTDPLTRYLRAVLEDGDYMNDWLGHIPGPSLFIDLLIYLGWFIARVTGA